MSYSLHPGSESRKARQEQMAQEREAKRLVEEARLAEEAKELADKLAAEETFDPEDAVVSDEPFSEELKDYASMTVAELKALCAERGLTVSGTKPELIARLTADDDASDSTEAPVETAAEEDTATPDEESAVAPETKEGEVSESEGEKQ